GQGREGEQPRDLSQWEIRCGQAKGREHGKCFHERRRPSQANEPAQRCRRRRAQIPRVRHGRFHHAVTPATICRSPKSARERRFVMSTPTCYVLVRFRWLSVWSPSPRPHSPSPPTCREPSATKLAAPCPVSSSNCASKLVPRSRRRRMLGARTVSTGSRPAGRSLRSH